jgi:hypothetical protein
MHQVTILKSIQRDDIEIVLARNAQGRLFVGVPMVRGDPACFVFVYIDHVTALEIERGTVDLFTVLEERATGPHFVATSDKAPDRL